MEDSVNTESVSNFIDDAEWAVQSTYYTVLKSSLGAAIFGRDMLLDIPYLADWTKIGEYRQAQTDRNTLHENASRVNFNYAVRRHVMVQENGILWEGADKYNGPFRITKVHINGTIRIQKGAIS